MEVQPAGGRGGGLRLGRRKAAVKLHVTTNLIVLLGRSSPKRGCEKRVWGCMCPPCFLRAGKWSKRDSSSTTERCLSSSSCENSVQSC